ncbi:MAG: glycosyl hydrolase-related protein [Fimbriimonas sp.]
MSTRRITYTFGNHMHWVDMEWLWGYHVLPGSVRDMLTFCQQTGARGNVNFEGVGYERLAAEDPEALADLRHAVRKGIVEVVGASYGQPYGGLHGGESNVRQRVYGVRAVRRTLGVRPRAFWEEEFDFFPQLPQLLAGCGFQNASLFFQWTWHTPEVPMEEVPAVWWEAPDGSRLRCATRNRLNLHQWPEDVQILMDELAQDGDAKGAEANALILQWLELMPSPDWMCRSEVLLPKTKELLSDPRFDVTFATLSGYLESLPEPLPVRRYTPDEVFHGMTLGKNGDLFRRFSRNGEHTLLAAETFAAVAGRFGRPYVQWDVYPTWELEEAWRELLQAQHHDNDECEGLCGHVGQFSYERSLSLTQHVLGRTTEGLLRRVDAPEGSLVAFNPLGWSVSGTVGHPQTGELILVRDIPPMGWKAFDAAECVREPDVWHLTTEGAIGRRRGLEVTVDAKGRIAQISSPQWPEGALAAPLLDFSCVEDGERVRFELESMEIDETTGDLVIRYQHPVQGSLRVDLRLAFDVPALDVVVTGGFLRRMDGGMNAGLSTRFGLVGGVARLVTDSPYAVHEVEGRGNFRKKYPTGDWMTSPQWFEEIRDPFHSLSLVDLLEGDGRRGMLIAHDGSPQWFRRGDEVENLLTCYDPWDENYWIDGFRVAYRLVPHGGITRAERFRAAQSFLRPPLVEIKGNNPGDLPPEHAGVRVNGKGVAATALFRETRDRGDGFPEYAARDFEADYPYVLRLAEFDGHSTEVTVEFAGTVSAVARTDFLGERTDRPVALVALEGKSKLSLNLRPYEVTTLYLDIEEGRKRARDLDAHRNVWATVHRVD